MSFENIQRSILPAKSNLLAPRQGLVFDGSGVATAAMTTAKTLVFTFTATADSDILGLGWSTGSIRTSISGGNLRIETNSPYTVYTTPVTLGKTYQVVYVGVAGSPLLVYINGILTITGSNNLAADITAYTSALRLGANHSNDASFVGRISSPLLYNRALSAAEVVALYEAGAPSGADYNSASNTAYATATGATLTVGGSASTSQNLGSLNLTGKRIRYDLNITAIDAGATVRVYQLNAGATDYVELANYTTTGARTLEFTYLNTTLAYVRFYVGVTGSGSATIAATPVYRLGLLLAPDAGQAGGGLVWYDTSGNAANITLPASGVSWNVPSSRVLGGNWTNTGNLTVSGTTASTNDTSGAFQVIGGAGLKTSAYINTNGDTGRALVVGPVAQSGGNLPYVSIKTSASFADFALCLENPNTTAGLGNGLRIVAGAAANDFPILIRNQANSSTLFSVSGTGNTTLSGNLTVSGTGGVTASASFVPITALGTSGSSGTFVSDGHLNDLQGNTSQHFLIKRAKNTTTQSRWAFQLQGGENPSDSPVGGSELVFAYSTAATGTFTNALSLTRTGNATLSGNLTVLGTNIYGNTGATGTLTIKNTSGNNNAISIVLGSTVNSDNGGVDFYTAGSSSSLLAGRFAGTSGNLLIGGTADISGSSGLKVFGTTASTSTTTGALIVSGGVGVAGAINAGTGLTTKLATNNSGSSIFSILRADGATPMLTATDAADGLTLKFGYTGLGNSTNWVSAGGQGSGASFVINNGVVGSGGGIVYQVNTLTRWYLSRDAAIAESGSNVGSDFLISSYNDAGSFLATPFKITRSNGNVTMTGNLTVNGTGTHSFTGPILITGTSASNLLRLTKSGAGSKSFGIDNALDFRIYADNGSTELFKLTDGGAATLAGNFTVSGTGTSSFAGNVSITNPANAYTTITAPNTASSSFGLRINAGTNTNDRALTIFKADTSTSLFFVNGGGDATLAGNLTVSSTTDANSAPSGSIYTAGGIAVGTNKKFMASGTGGYWGSASAGNQESLLIRGVGFGYNPTSYAAVQIGGTAGRSLAFGVDVSAINGSSFSGAANEWIIPNTLNIRQVTSAGTDFSNVIFSVGNGGATTIGGNLTVSGAGTSSVAGGLNILSNSSATGSVDIGADARASNLRLSLNAAAGNDREIITYTAGLQRWKIAVNGTAESGSNAGSNWSLQAYADNGSTSLGNAISITRSTLATTLGGNLTVSGGTIGTAASTNLTLNGGSSGASLVLGQGANGAVDITPAASGSGRTIIRAATGINAVLSIVQNGYIIGSVGSGVVFSLTAGSGDATTQIQGIRSGGASTGPIAMQPIGGNLLLGTTTDSGNGKLQLADHTTSAGGIGFGTGANDVIYKRLAGVLRSPTTFEVNQLTAISDGTAASPSFRFLNNTATGLYFVANGLGLTTNGTVALTLDSSQNATFAGSAKSTSATGGIGYATGAGGAVTQATDRTTGVTLNKVAGAITLVSAAGTTTWQSFTVTNSTVADTDTIIVNQKSGADLYQIFVTNVAAGSFKITFATTGGTTTEQPVFNFAVIKAVAA